MSKEKTTYKVKCKGFEAIYSDYNRSQIAFQKQLSTMKKADETFTLTLSEKTDKGTWEVIDKVKIEK